MPRRREKGGSRYGKGDTKLGRKSATTVKDTGLRAKDARGPCQGPSLVGACLRSIGAFGNKDYKTAKGTHTPQGPQRWAREPRARTPCSKTRDQERLSDGAVCERHGMSAPTYPAAIYEANIRAMLGNGHCRRANKHSAKSGRRQLGESRTPATDFRPPTERRPRKRPRNNPQRNPCKPGTGRHLCCMRPRARKQA